MRPVMSGRSRSPAAVTVRSRPRSSPRGASVSIRCYIAVNGQEVTGTLGGAFGVVGLAYGELRFTASDTDVVTFHAYVCTSHGCFTHQYETERMQVPPQGDQIRVSGKKRDDLQAAIQALKAEDFDLPLQFTNFRD